jgi:hypothetical protein
VSRWSSTHPRQGLETPGYNILPPTRGRPDGARAMGFRCELQGPMAQNQASESVPPVSGLSRMVGHRKDDDLLATVLKHHIEGEAVEDEAFRATLTQRTGYGHNRCKLPFEQPKSRLQSPVKLRAQTRPLTLVPTCGFHGLFGSDLEKPDSALHERDSRSRMRRACSARSTSVAVPASSSSIRRVSSSSQA